MKAVHTLFDGWTKQAFNWPTDYAGGKCVVSHLGTVMTVRVGEFAKHLAKKYEIPINVQVRTDRQLKVLSGKDFPVNVLIYANDKLKLTPQDFVTADLEYQFSIEDAGTEVVI